MDDVVGACSGGGDGDEDEERRGESSVEGVTKRQKGKEGREVCWRGREDKVKKVR